MEALIVQGAAFVWDMPPSPSVHRGGCGWTGGKPEADGIERDGFVPPGGWEDQAVASLSNWDPATETGGHHQGPLCARCSSSGRRQIPGLWIPYSAVD